MFSNQSDNIVHGPLAGRDNNITNNEFHTKKTQIGFLYDRLKAEVAQQDGLIEFVEELQHYMGRAAEDIQRSLADKLIDSGRVDLVQVAEEFKEAATKKIMRFQSSPAAQDIFAYVLGELHSKYLMHVRPLIASGASRASIDSAMETYVTNPIAESMEPSALGLTPKLILALLFYLAGNCHVQWD